MFMDFFDALPIACIVDDKYLAMHGGISPNLNKLDDINQVNRFQEVPLEGLFCDLMWADPMKDEAAKKGIFRKNQERECSNYFGKQPVKKLLRENRLMSIFRGHQVQAEGYKMHRWGGKDLFPYVVTIFSAPNYCGYYSNQGSILLLEEGDMKIKQYDETEPPFRLPDGLNVFSWSLPFLAEKVSQMLYSIIKKCHDNSEHFNYNQVLQDELDKDARHSKKHIKQKILAVAKICRMHQTLRENAEEVMQIKNISPDGKLPRGILLEGKQAIKDAAEQFNLAKHLDRDHEKWPVLK